MIEFAFWAAVILVAYPYLIYPVVVVLVGAIRTRPVLARRWEPAVTVLIPAYNEADCIAATVQNKLDQDYPSEKLQIIVVSDGSTDGTDDIVRRFAGRGVELLRREGREGKAAALNEAVRHARGELIVFSDANSIFHADAIRRMAEAFADRDVGYVTGSLGFFDDRASLSGSGVGAYMRYENMLRRAETRMGSIIGVNGGVDAIRRELYVDTPPRLITDFVLPLEVIARGHRVVFEPRAESRESPNIELDSEFRMRVRVALRALQGMVYMRRLLNPLRYPLVSFCLLSHKLLRYLAFLFMLLALACNAALAFSTHPLAHALYFPLLVLQAACYGFAFLGMAKELPAWLRRLTVVPSYVVMSYAAFAVALFRFLRGDTMAVWRPRTG